MLTEKQRMQAALRQHRFRQRQREAPRREQVAKGLPALPAMPTLPGDRRWHASLLAAEALVRQVHEEMDAYYSERSENWQEGEAGMQFEQRQEAVKGILTQLEEAALEEMRRTRPSAARHGRWRCTLSEPPRDLRGHFR